MLQKKKSFCIFTSVGRKNEPIVHKRAQSLIADGFEVFFVVNDEFPNEDVDGLHIVSTGKKQGSWLKRIILSPIIIYKLLGQIDADVYQTYSVEFLLLCLLLKHRNKKVIFDLREPHPYTLTYKFKKVSLKTKIMIKLIKSWMRYCLKRVDLTITVSDDIINYLRDWGITNAMIIGNYPSVISEHDFTYEDYCKRSDSILYYGSIYVISRQEVFFEALKEIPNIKYVLAGKFEYDYYKEEVMKHPYWNQVVFVDGFNRKQLLELLRSSTISNTLRDFSMLVGCQSGSNGIIKLYESMEAGLPIICSDVPVYKKMMQKYPCGLLVDANNPRQIRDAIIYLTTHKKEAYEMGQMGRKAVIEQYNWETESKRYIGAINSLLKI